ncbi:MAG TPA: ATPase, T2SS/T4P/T4SS family, partial [Bradyrhizobium sp.]
MANDLSVRFVDYLRQNNHLAPIDGSPERTGQGADVRQLKLWEVTSLSPTEFADEATRFFALGRLTLQDMTSAEPLVGAFSPRFLRETMVYPCRMADGSTVLAVVDPTDQATLRAAQIVLGAGINVKVASSEDVAIALNNSSSADEAETADTATALPREDDIESLRDLASGAPVVRAVNDLLEKAVEMRASDIHIEPFQSGLVVRMRIDGLLRQVAAPANVLPQAVISRIKIVANLN